MRSRVLLSLIVTAVSFSLSAQTNEIGVFFNRASLSSNTASDPADALTARVKFDPKTGYGISFSQLAHPISDASRLTKSRKCSPRWACISAWKCRAGRRKTSKSWQSASRITTEPLRGCTGMKG